MAQVLMKRAVLFTTVYKFKYICFQGIWNAMFHVSSIYNYHFQTALVIIEMLL